MAGPPFTDMCVRLCSRPTSIRATCRLLGRAPFGIRLRVGAAYWITVLVFRPILMPQSPRKTVSAQSIRVMLSFPPLSLGLARRRSRERSIVFLRNPQSMEQDCEFARYRYDSFPFRSFPASFCELHSPASESAVVSAMPENVLSAFNKQHSKIRIPCFRDSQSWITFSRLISCWLQAEVACNITTLLKTVLIGDS